jgi:hypothetical protein
MSDNVENTIIEISEIKSEQVNSTIAPTVTKRIRKKKGEVKATNVVIIENKPDTDANSENNIENSIVNEALTATDPDTNADNTIVKEEKVHKKRGRKPKGGKIIINNNAQVADTVHEYNIILHLKCGEHDLVHNNFLSSINYDPTVHVVETFQFENSKDLNYQIINNENDNENEKDNSKNINNINNNNNTFIGGIDFNNKGNNNNNNNTIIKSNKNNMIKSNEPEEFDYTKHLWKKIKELTINLHKNNIQDKKSDCFWCTCPFDNPPLYIPKYELNNIYYCYGCFCSPECATAFLFKETIDTSTRFERYHLLNHIYCKIYNYTKNIKPAPDPYYTLNKYYGNLTIQEYRLLLKNERILIVVDKPLSRILPELHEDNDDFINNMKVGSSSSTKFHIKKKTNKSDGLSHA